MFREEALETFWPNSKTLWYLIKLDAQCVKYNYTGTGSLYMWREREKKRTLRRKGNKAGRKFAILSLVLKRDSTHIPFRFDLHNVFDQIKKSFHEMLKRYIQ